MALGTGRLVELEWSHAVTAQNLYQVRLIKYYNFCTYLLQKQNILINFYAAKLE